MSPNTCQRYFPPSTINIAIFSTSSDGKLTYIKTQTLDFTNEYLPNVLPNEWYASWDRKALDAGALATKTYAWYHQSFDWKFPQYNAALDNTTRSQVYKPNTATAATNAAYADEADFLITDSQGNIFETSYSAGPYSGAASDGKHMYQNGTEWYAVNEGWSAAQMVAFYYSYYNAKVTSYYANVCPNTLPLGGQ
ncbi:MAG: SpoIID/LytB domain-containing protein [Thermoflavifilum sp.]|nr:SpoIID/LytB domain-containing protein [Thermoflavifilum sp.]MCL6514731.1 SpoIID/LytB domain-containing protein [Alicyclobacillus sp.]